jgi:hypothetical protein
MKSENNLVYSRSTISLHVAFAFHKSFSINLYKDYSTRLRVMMDLATALWNKRQARSRAKERLAMLLHRVVDSPGDLDWEHPSCYMLFV